MSQNINRAEPDTLGPLQSYGIDLVTGFVPPDDPLARLPAEFEPWETVASELGPLIRSRRIREALAVMPRLDVTPLVSEAERERALLLLTMFANAWVWGGDEPHLSIPAPVSLPLCTLAQALDRPPIAHYGSMALRNWRRVDPMRPIAADNARMDVCFLGGVDEEWFYIASMGVELEGAAMLGAIHAATLAAQQDGDAALAMLVERIAGAMDSVMAALERTREWCDPYIFYNRVRAFAATWPEPGVVYEGVWPEPRRYIGASAGQSSLIQAVDGVLGIVHDGAMTASFFREMRRYMPPAHRRFVEEVAAGSCVRSRAERGTAQLRDAYNRAVRQVERFRAAHRRIAHDFVTVPSGKASGATGTGGTTLADFLLSAERETSSSLF